MASVARISTYRFDPDKPELEALRAEKRRIWTEAVQEEVGHLGELCLVTDDGRQIVIHLWESEEDARQASVAHNPRLRALIKEQFEPDYDTLWIAPPEHDMAKVITNSVDALGSLYAIVDGLNERFQAGNNPFQMVTRLCEEAGELASAVNHMEGAGAKQTKHGAPDRAHLTHEIQDVLRAAVAIARHYGLEDDVRRSIEDNRPTW